MAVLGDTTATSVTVLNNVSATSFTENGTALSSKYLGISSTAAKATADASGNNIANTYCKFYYGTSTTKGSNTSLSTTLRISLSGTTLNIWNS